MSARGRAGWCPPCRPRSLPPHAGGAGTCARTAKPPSVRRRERGAPGGALTQPACAGLCAASRAEAARSPPPLVTDSGPRPAGDWLAGADQPSLPGSTDRPSTGGKPNPTARSSGPFSLSSFKEKQRFSQPADPARFLLKINQVFVLGKVGNSGIGREGGRRTTL